MDDIEEEELNFDEDSDETNEDVDVMSEEYLLEQLLFVKDILKKQKLTKSNENEEQSEEEDLYGEDEISNIMVELRNVYIRGKNRREYMDSIVEECNFEISQIYEKYVDDVIDYEDLMKVGELYRRISEVYDDMGQYTKSLSYALIGLTCVERIDLDKSVDATLTNKLLALLNYQVSSAYSGTHDYRKAYTFIKKAKEFDSNLSIINAECGRVISNYKKKPFEVSEYLDRSIEIMKENQEKIVVSQSHYFWILNILKLPYVRRIWFLREHCRLSDSMGDVSKAKEIIRYHEDNDSYFLPHEGLVYSYCGVTLLRRFDFEKDRKLLTQSMIEATKAILLEPRRPANFNNRANALKLLKEYELGLEDMNIVLSIVPNTPLHRKNRGHLHYLMRNYDLAFDDFNECIEKSEGVDKFVKVAPVTYIYRGFINRARGMVREAESDFTTYIHIVGVSKNILLKRGNTREEIVNLNREEDLNWMISLPRATCVGLQNRGTVRSANSFRGMVVDMLSLYHIDKHYDFFTKVKKKDPVIYYQRWNKICTKAVVSLKDEIDNYFLSPLDRTEVKKKNFGVLNLFLGYCYKFLEEAEKSLKFLMNSESVLIKEERFDFLMEMCEMNGTGMRRIKFLHDGKEFKTIGHLFL